MYTNTIHDEAIRLVSETLNSQTSLQTNYGIKKPPTEDLIEMLSLILKHNSFEFNKQYFRQTRGCSMGSNASPEIADIAFHELEKKIIVNNHNNIHFWKRFRDDVFAIFLGTQTELTNFIQKINTMHPTFKFSYENSTQEITFLDVVVFKGARYHKENILDIKTHTKPTDTFQFLHRESCHPTATFNGFIKGEILRYART